MEFAVQGKSLKNLLRRARFRNSVADLSANEIMAPSPRR
jgi:hypothetical protein